MRHPIHRNHTKHAEDKLLVQIVFQFEREGLRITWDYVARRMKTKRPARQLRLRLASLRGRTGSRLAASHRAS
ncbi:hypothetical protein GQ600_25806 [Phytophthora cactorum]|nr:hypothetical protein GQ600_25806 [Phytophthora cactorum]